MDEINLSLDKIKQYIERENFIGFDPYDTLLSPFPFKSFGKWVPIIATQIQKRNPFNIRPFLGIKKEINPKAFGLFLLGYSLLYSKEKEPKYLERMNYFFNWLKNNSSIGYKGISWGYNFPWANPEQYLKPYVPSAVVTGFVCRGLFNFYKTTKNSDVISILDKAKQFVLEELPRYEDKTGISISYTPLLTDVCYNASLHAGEILASNYFINPDKKLKKIIIDIVNFVVHRQKEDGSWAYSEDPRSGKERLQIDFHQGYIIESIYEIKNLVNIHNDRWEIALRKGLAYYRSRQFFNSGKSLWRVPIEFPVDIHNQSQGIITFAKMKDYDNEYLGFGKTVAKWTIKNMQDKKGYFYYRINRFYKNRISYIRWSQAWMFVALSSLLIFEKKNENR